MEINRAWAMPNAETFTISPIKDFLKRHIAGCNVIVDPFARNSMWGTYRNDLNPNTNAQYNMDVYDFLELMVAQGVEADAIIFDPPYSLRQVKEHYQAIKGDGSLTLEDTRRIGTWPKEKDLCDKLLRVGGKFLHFGWHSNGIGKKRGYRIDAVLLVAHGRAHHDTICMVEIKEPYQMELI